MRDQNQAFSSSLTTMRQAAANDLFHWFPFPEMVLPSVDMVFPFATVKNRHRVVRPRHHLLREHAERGPNHWSQRVTSWATATDGISSCPFLAKFRRAFMGLSMRWENKTNGWIVKGTCDWWAFALPFGHVWPTARVEDEDSSLMRPIKWALPTFS